MLYDQFKCAFFICLITILFSLQNISASFAQADSEPVPNVSDSTSHDALTRGIELYRKIKFEEALQYFDKSVDEKPTDAEGHLWRAKCLEAVSRKKESIAEYKLAMLLTTDAAIKEECTAALRKQNEKVPAGSVTPPRSFKLSTKKLDWNLQIDSDLRNSIDAQDAQLAAVIGNGASQYPGGIRALRSRHGVELEAELRNGPPHSAFVLAAADLATFKNSDVYIILDHSGSMSSRDCPSGGDTAVSRLDWTIDELQGFTKSLEQALPHGFTFIPFNTAPQAYTVTNATSLSQLLRSLKSQGGTSLSPALELAFKYHERHMNQPLLIAIVTDGQINVNDVRKTIADATRKFPMPNGIAITFAEVGIAASEGTALLFQMQKRAQQQGSPVPPLPIGLEAMLNLKETANAAYNPCLVVPFKQLRAEGLGRAILRALRANLPPPAEVKEYKKQK
jgi:tetratricopeptide (TPR) repeat protein